MKTSAIRLLLGVTTVLSTLISTGSLRASEARRLDNPFTLHDVVSVSKAGGVQEDRGSKKNGDYSLLITGKGKTTVTLTPGLYVAPWQVGDATKLSLWLRAEGVAHETWTITLFDDRHRKAWWTVDGASASDWKQIKLDFSALRRDADFKLSELLSLQLAIDLGEQGKCWLDDVRFERASGAAIGITDKTIDEYRHDAEQSRPTRVAEAMRHPVTVGLREGLNRFFAELAEGNNLEKTNADLLDVLTTKDRKVREAMRLDDLWCLVTNQTLYRIYYSFGSKGRVQPGRLSPLAEAALLRELWDRTKDKNDIALARQSTWWLEGSENHDIVAKVSNLLASQIFAHEPDYADRTLPNRGTGGGEGFWFGSLYGGSSDRGPLGRGHYADGESYRPKDHVVAWTAFWKEYLAERAKKGFFVEIGSPSYALTTMSYIYDLADLADDPELRECARKFLDLVWAEWAQDQLDGIRGGARTRANEPARALDFVTEIIRFEMGGKAMARSHHFSLHYNTYRLPDVVWGLILDRESLGEFTYISRKPGEEPNRWPRPPGTERSLTCDTESRLRRESWVTPDYILGTQMDHPGALLSHLTVSSRYQGVLFAGPTAPRVFPAGFNRSEGAGESWKIGPSLFRSVMHQRVMIVQEARSVMRTTPDWFPTTTLTADKIGILFHGLSRRRVESDGWIFVQQDNSYLAVKPVLTEFHEGYALLKDRVSDQPLQALPGAYAWSKDGTVALLADRYSPIIFETARVTDYPSLDEFMVAIKQNPLTITRTVVPGYPILTYRGAGLGAKRLELNAASVEIPRIDGAYVNYQVPAFSSPYLKGEYGSGRIAITYRDKSLNLDFSNIKYR